jgi:triacylglycerol esterase/lipase EstA (alpha/beta hydrolase family)
MQERSDLALAPSTAHGAKFRDQQSLKQGDEQSQIRKEAPPLKPKPEFSPQIPENLLKMYSLRALVASALLGTATVQATPFEINDFSCKSDSNPIILLHGLGATYYEDINLMQFWLQNQGYCTYSLTYGAYDEFPLVGGLKHVSDSATEIASYIKKVVHETGKSKVDLIGHSEGALQTLYVAKFENVSHIIDKIVPIAPPTHGTSFANLYKAATVFDGKNGKGVKDALEKAGCGACSDLVSGGAAIKQLNDGNPIVQPGNSVTIVTSKFDELVTPVDSSFVREAGVRNLYIQDICPFDPVGHIGEAYDLNVWELVKNVLDSTPDRRFVCVV